MTDKTLPPGVIDAAWISALVLTFFDYLPKITAVVILVWYLIQIAEKLSLMWARYRERCAAKKSYRRRKSDERAVST